MITEFKGPYAFLSNFFPDPYLLGGTLEHEYQAGKTFNSTWRERILSCPTPACARRMGKYLLPAEFIHPNWNLIRVDWMRELIRKKFSLGNHPLLAQLLNTGSQELIEGNRHHDNFWGSCYCSIHFSRTSKQPAQNNLGKLLMERRRELQSLVIVHDWTRPRTRWDCPKRDYTFIQEEDQLIGKLPPSCPNHGVPLVHAGTDTFLESIGVKK